jgi:hypothetical protein
MAADSLVEPDDFGSLVDLAVQRTLVSEGTSRTGTVHRAGLQSVRERLDQLDEQLLEQLRRTRATHRLASLCRRL